MRDPITDAAQDPSCLLCLTPDRGGSWWSRLRPPTPRNFADNPMAWTDAKTALDVTDQSHDFTFEIEFKCVKTNAVYIFASDGSNDFIRVFMSSGEIIVSTALLSTASGGSTQFSAGSDSTNRHALTVKMIENTITALIDGEIVYTRENLVRNAIEISAPRSNAGYVYKISITDDTTGEIVWQAAYSDLYDTSNPWPSPVPENFAENAKAFYDCQAVVREALDPTHDYSFLIDFKLDEAKTSGNVFYAIPSDAPFALILQSNNQIDFFTNLLKPNGDSNSFASIYAYYQSDVKLQGRHQIECKIEANMLSSYLDGVLVAQKTSNLERTGTATVGIPNCNSGYVYKIKITDLTDNQVVWSYPSEAERVRLITKTNVRTDRGAFEAADENTIAGVATQLDLRGNATSKTFIVRAFCPAHDPASGKLYIHPFFGQGAINQSASLYTFQFSLWEDRRSGGTTQLFPTISTGTDTPGANVTGAEIYLDQWHTYAMVIDYNGGNCYIRAFVDGVLLRERTVSGTPAWNTSATTTAQETTVGIRRDPNASYYAGSLTRITAALVFDRALSAAEIAALTPKKQPLSWAGIRDVVRRGRAQRYFAVGDVLTVATPRWTIEYEVTGFDQVEPANTALTHSMTLLPVRLVADLQFDAPEPGNPDARRAQYGCNRWDWSAIRQWMNSAAAPGEWWTAQHEYDAAPAYAATLAGFMADLPADFLSAVAPARLTTALPNADGGGSVETVDRFWLPSRTEIFGDANNGVAEGVLMAKYVDATDADRIKQNGNGAADRWRLRSATLSHAHPVYLVSSDGTFFVAGHGAAVVMGIVPACIIA
ncbi:MAG: DUF6273 domain-containing protein [Victivallis sp.]